MFRVYVVYNQIAQKIYIGQTHDVESRIVAHNYKHKKDSFTSRFEGEWKLIYVESFPTRSEAIKREKQLKSSRGRAYIQQYIPEQSGTNPG